MDSKTQRKEFGQIITILKKLSSKDVETLRKLIERQKDYQNERTKGESRDTSYWYFSGRVDIWNKVFRALMEGKSK